METKILKSCDIAIIGAGPGGYELAIDAYKNGLKVILIEEKSVGGVCLNSGCIPTKAYYQYAKTILNTKKFFDCDVSFDLEKINSDKNQVVDLLTKGILEELKGVDIIYGHASFNSDKKLTVNEFIIDAKNVVIATGSSDKRLNIKGANLSVSSKELLDLKETPKSLAIIGGGVIGIEMASIFNALGTKVTVLEYLPNILSNFDKDVSRRLQNMMRSKGIDIVTNAKVEEILEEKENKIVKYKVNDKEVDVVIDCVMMATGRIVDCSLLGLENLNIEYSNKGIKVDKITKETTCKNVYAIGDCNGELMLAHKATFDGKRVLNNILNVEDCINFNYVPSCVFSFPEVSSIGLTEEECKERNISIKIIKELYRSIGKAQAIKETDGFLKLIVSDSKIIGASIIGADANLLINEIMVIMNSDVSVDEAKHYIHAHPTLSEIIQKALNNIK